jgi:hypothetical protein
MAQFAWTVVSERLDLVWRNPVSSGRFSSGLSAPEEADDSPFKASQQRAPPSCVIHDDCPSSELSRH